jgi:CheY-like chemotaxis protein
MEKKRILIVEDDPDTCLLLSQLFEKIGYDLTITNNGRDAIVSIKNQIPDLVIFDVKLPDMDGWEAYQQISEGKDLPALCLSAVPSHQMASYGLKMGEVDYLHKPFYNDDLLARVNALVNRPDNLPANPAVPWGDYTTQRPKVSVIIPTLNEADNLPLIFPYFPMNWVDEMILVDGCSTDGTIEVARRLFPSIKVVLEKTPGKGAALKAGYRAATGDILVVLDADGSHDPREIPRFVSALMEGADFVKGSRFAPGGGTTDMPRYRQMGNGAFVILTNLLFSASFTDLCYGFHAFWKYCLDAIDLEDVNGFEIDTALYLGALRTRLRITEVPSFEGYRFNGQGKLKTLPDGWRVLMTITRQSLKKMKNDPQTNYLGFRGMNAGYLPVPANPHTSSATAGDRRASSATAGDRRINSGAAGDRRIGVGDRRSEQRPEKPVPASELGGIATVVNPLYKKKAAPESNASSTTDNSKTKIIGDPRYEGQSDARRRQQ